MARRKHKPPLRIGVTGGIGSGKSAVCALFAQSGRTVISADDIARDLTEHNPAVRNEIESVFGSGLYRANGSLERQRLAEIVFGDAGAREKLNAIVHPRVFVHIDAAIARLGSPETTSYVLIEAALIYETGMDRRLDYTIVVDAPEEVRIARVMARDGCTRDQVLRRIDSQMPVEAKLRRADFVVDNSGTEAELAGRVAFLDALFSQLVEVTH